jgi:hypothetical protein
LKIRVLVVVQVVSEVAKCQTAQVRMDCCCTFFLPRVFSHSGNEFLFRKVFNEAAEPLEQFITSQWTCISLRLVDFYKIIILLRHLVFWYFGCSGALVLVACILVIYANFCLMI